MVTVRAIEGIATFDNRIVGCDTEEEAADVAEINRLLRKHGLRLEMTPLESLPMEPSAAQSENSQ